MSDVGQGDGLAADSAAGTEARFRRGLMGLVLLGAVSQYLIQSQAYSVNPMALVPQVDAATIWEHAGRIAGGEIVGDQPYDTAPLVLWVAGALRALGGGLVAWGVFQSVLHVATAVLIALFTRGFATSLGSVEGPHQGMRSIATSAGLLAGALFLVLDEPAASTSRVLSASLQLFLASSLLLLLRPKPPVASASALRDRLGAGAVLGLFCLAYPPMMAGVPMLALWVYFTSGKNVREALALVGAAGLAILPATIHNVRASGELIPISAQAGLTFYHGNNSEADGTIAPVGVVNNKGEQAADSLNQARAVLGPDAGWKDASNYWMGKGLEWWGEAPGAAAKLAFVKLWYALSGQRYGDVYQPWRERDDGVASRLWLAPLPLAWLMPLALVALLRLLWVRTGRANAVPLAVMVVVPIAVVVAFFYTPRYRMPSAAAVVPLVAMLVASLAVEAKTSGRARASVLAGLALLVGAASGTLNRWGGFDVDATGIHELRFYERMASASGRLDRHGNGARYLEKVLRLDPANDENRGRLFDLVWYLAASSEAAERDPAAALEVTENLIAEFGPAPPLLDVRGTAKAALGDFTGALQDVEAALAAMAPGDPARVEIEQRQVLFAGGRVFELRPLNQ